MNQWTIISEVDRNCKPTRAGAPQVGVKTEKGWVKLHGGPLNELKPGDKIEMSEPAQFGKSWYAELKSIEPRQEQAPAAGNGNGNGAGKLPWAEYLIVAKAAHALALDLEPDLTEAAESETAEGEAHGVTLVRTDRSQARAALVNTAMIAFANGKIAVPELTDDDIPF